MKGKILWLVVSCLLALSLVVASCAPTVPTVPTAPTAPTAPTTPTTPTAPEPEMVKLSLTKLDGTVVEKLVEKPKYGGVFTFGIITPPTGFDAALYTEKELYTLHLTNECLRGGDWARGPSGTGEMSWAMNIYPYQGQWCDLLCVSWEVPNPETVIIGVRKGVHYALDLRSEASRLVNGREMDA